MTVSLELPDSFASVDPRYLKEALVAVLYHTGKLSERQAREALGMTRAPLKSCSLASASRSSSIAGRI